MNTKERNHLHDIILEYDLLNLEPGYLRRPRDDVVKRLKCTALLVVSVLGWTEPPGRSYIPPFSWRHKREAAPKDG